MSPKKGPVQQEIHLPIKIDFEVDVLVFGGVTGQFVIPHYNLNNQGPFIHWKSTKPRPHGPWLFNRYIPPGASIQWGVKTTVELPTGRAQPSNFHQGSGAKKMVRFRYPVTVCLWDVLKHDLGWFWKMIMYTPSMLLVCSMNFARSAKPTGLDKTSAFAPFSTEVWIPNHHLQTICSLYTHEI